MKARVKPPEPRPLRGEATVAWQKKCPKQFAVRHGEPLGSTRVHFEAFMLSLVLLNGQNEEVFSHPEQTALHSITEMEGGIDSSDLVRPESQSSCLQDHCQFFRFFFCKLNYRKSYYAPQRLIKLIGSFYGQGLQTQQVSTVKLV